MRFGDILRALALAALTISGAWAQPADTIAVEGGRIRGVAADAPGVTLYKAVPFAAPPVGPNRWRAPQPVQPWTGVRESNAWPNRCYQLASANPPGTFYFNEFYWDPARDPKDSEDCLYLNIWAPQRSAGAPLPVLVFYHGGGNRHGNNSEVEFDAARLAAKGVIVVTAAYRLNLMGFLALPGMPAGEAGNFAVLDTVESLKWVQRNIAALGGDPANVTIMGQSAGSRNVRTLLSTPLAQGLFRRAIMHSSPTVMVQPGKSNYVALADKQAAAAAMFQKHFPGMTLDDLRKLPPEAFYGDAARTEELYGVSSGSYAALDGQVITTTSADLLRPGALNGVDVMLGTVADERTALDGAPDRQMDVAAFQATWKKQLGDALYAKYGFEQLYPASTRLDAWRQHMKAGADLLLEQNRIAGPLLKANNPSSKVYVFYFDHPTPGRDREYYGSWHSSDLWYVLASLRNEPGQRQWSPYDFQLAEQASTLWANFVKTGDPNGPGLPAWPQASTANHGTYLWFAERSVGATERSPYFGTAVEQRNALFHEWQLQYYGRR
ncbi:carboxylesterase family protein [Ramlibacter sp. G-1-2-2]|uniref:Carboxylesterase family protein n=1 Tax=Ramlibacter agri TaxID=2728837 RepID=A0A848HG11_9BURK|nr:carboxylesterase family protein [Ramlibacter agri]NML47453.1 carboxylesterase family protein [Ramlibacter agri]